MAALHERLERRLTPLRHLSLVAVVTSLFGAGLLFLIGVVKTIKAFWTYASVLADFQVERSYTTDAAVAFLIQGVDAFLIGLVFIIFSFGIYTLFMHPIQVSEHSAFRWIRIRSINDLKVILGELIVIVLFVKFLEIVLQEGADLTYEFLVLPVGIVLLALALKFLGLKGEGDSR